MSRYVVVLHECVLLRMGAEHAAGKQQRQIVIGGDPRRRCYNCGYRGDRGHSGDGKAEHDEVVQRFALKVRWWTELQCRLNRRLALNFDGVAHVEFPVRVQRLAFAPPAAKFDHVAVADDSLPTDVDAGDTAFGDCPRPWQVKILGGLCVFGLAPHVVQLSTEGIGDHEHGIGEYARALFGDGAEVRPVDGITETHRDFRCRRVVDRGVDGFYDGNLVHPLAEPGRHDGQELGETRVDAAAEDGRSAQLTCLGEAIPACTQTVTGDKARCPHNIDACAEDTDQFMDVRKHRVVDDTVRLQGEQCLNVIGGLYT